MKPSTSYLRECARANDWLQFIIHSQLHSHHPEEVSHRLFLVIKEEEMEHFSEDSVLSVVYHRLLFAMVTIFTAISVAWLQTKDQSLLLKSGRKILCGSRLNLETHSDITNHFVKLCGHF